MQFILKAPFQSAGDQKQAIEKIAQGIQKGVKIQTLLGITGSGKTFTASCVIERCQRPVLVISHNKTLAAQLASEFHQFFPQNAVHYFVSFYDYYQPEAYIPQTDTYIEKETDLNEEIDRLRHAATQSLLARRDVIIVASVSCIYGLGPKSSYARSSKKIFRDQRLSREEFLTALIHMRYERNDIDFHRGTFRVIGDVVDVFPASSDHDILRVEFFGPEIERLSWHDALTMEPSESLESHPDEAWIFPASHYLAPTQSFDDILQEIERDAEKQIHRMKQSGKLLEAERLGQRIRFDIEMLKQTGYVNGIENYSRYFDRRTPGSPPSTLLDFFPNDFLVFIDESHMTIPQIRGMFEGDRSRKQTLVDYGFRLPAALDNRPLNFTEFEQRIGQTIFMSATPGLYETQKSDCLVEQIIRPTGLLDPSIEVRPTKHQIDNLIEEIRKRIEREERVIVTTLTKRMAEELSDYLKDLGISTHYLHSDIDTFERLEILRDLRVGTFDVLIGINLLREGLDLPEVSLVAILDADKEGFLRSETSLIQTIGRASRHINGHVILYADVMTGSMETAITLTKQRRSLQQEHNLQHNITPRSIEKKIGADRLSGAKKESDLSVLPGGLMQKNKSLSSKQKKYFLSELKQKMKIASRNLEFELAAEYRDAISTIMKEKSR